MKQLTNEQNQLVTEGYTYTLAVAHNTAREITGADSDFGDEVAAIALEELTKLAASFDPNKGQWEPYYKSLIGVRVKDAAYHLLGYTNGERPEVLSLDAPIAESDGGEVVTLADTIPDPHNPFGAVEDKVMVEQIMAGLSETDSELIRLRFMEDLTLDKIARKTGRSKSGVKKRLDMALGRMKEQMKDGMNDE